ncbi:hypothetical protein [Xylella fastidiosa]|nr:hypothetical protein [Xylella fastidiosa]AIC13497.1 hypothetical protein P303_00555 [Xylella fastidiosa MUL0034]
MSYAPFLLEMSVWIASLDLIATQRNLLCAAYVVGLHPDVLT